MDLTDYRERPIEKERVASLMRLVPAAMTSALDIGARDGFLSRKLADLTGNVTALDLEQPDIDDARIRCIAGDATRLPFADRSFDLVFCAEVLEHVPLGLLLACGEIARVARHSVIIGVPFRQDIRVGRLTCRACGKVSPPWGHVNSFDEAGLGTLFPDLRVVCQDFVGKSAAPTNALSAWMMDLAGNPFGPYGQEERCIHCDAAFTARPPRSIPQRLLTRGAVKLQSLMNLGHQPHGNWIHQLLQRRQVDAAA